MGRLGSGVWVSAIVQIFALTAGGCPSWEGNCPGGGGNVGRICPSGKI